MTTPSAPGGPDNDPSDRIRIGDAERESALKALGQHMSEGRLTMSEYDDRASAVAAAMTASEVRVLFVDLPSPHPELTGTPRPLARRPTQQPVGAGAAAVARSDSRTVAQRVTAVAVGLSAVISVALFFALGTWLVFLIPAALSVAAGAWWGKDWRDP